MVNPVISQRKPFLLYLLLWSIIAVLHSYFIYQYFPNNSWSLSLLDGLVFNFVFAWLGIGVWYAVAYNNFENRNFFSIILINLVIGVLLVFVWYWLSFTIMKILLPEDAAYLPLIKASISWRMLVGFFYFVILVLIFYAIINYHSLQMRKANEAELQSLVDQAELSNLKAQMNPHFIFNSLNSISALTINQPRQAREMIIKLSEFLRYSLRQQNKEQLVTLMEELTNIEKYLAIEKIRFGERLQVAKSIEVNPEDYRIPIFILQPLFENAIKHGVYESIAPILIEFGIKQDNNWVVIKISNNFDPEATTRKGAGIGLQNIRNRLKLIYGNPELISIKKEEANFKVELVIPQL